MKTLKLFDNTEINILEGATLDHTTIVADSFTSLGLLAKSLIKKDNLKTVQYITDAEITGNYEDLRLVSPLFKSIDFDTENKVVAVISMREKTELEKRIEALENGQEVQDGAISDLGDIVSTIAEGGTI